MMHLDEIYAKWCKNRKQLPGNIKIKKSPTERGRIRN